MNTSIIRLPKQDKPSTSTPYQIDANGNLIVNGVNMTPFIFQGGNRPDILTGAITGVNNLKGDVESSITKPINDLITNITSKTTLLNIGGVVFGGVMIILGLQSLLKSEVIKTAKNAVGV